MDVGDVANALSAISTILITLGLLIAVFSLASRSRDQERRITRLEQAVAEKPMSPSSALDSTAPR